MGGRRGLPGFMCLIGALTIVVANAVAAAGVLSGSTSPSVAASAFTPGVVSLQPLGGAKCPADYACEAFTVTCDGVVQSAPGYFARRNASSAPRGMVILFSDSAGKGWWSATPKPAALAKDLAIAGFEVVQVRWRDGWSIAAPGDAAGPAHLGCRPAGIIRWLYENAFVPLGITPNGIGICGFCIVGTSGGSSQVAFALSHFGLEGILDAALLLSGPPHAAMSKGCLQVQGEKKYWYTLSESNTMDASFGFSGNSGPCVAHDASWASRWLEESPDTGGSDHVHPTTRVQFLFGQNDGGNSVAHGTDYYERLRSSGSPMVVTKTLPGVGHGIENYDLGVTEIKNVLLYIPPVIDVGDVTVPEGSGAAALPLILSSSSDLAVSVRATTIDVTAIAGEDYVQTSETVTFTPGQTSGSVSVPIIADDSPESEETFAIVLDDVQNAAIGDGSWIATIADDDTPMGAVLAVADGSGLEDSGSIVFSVTLTPAAADAVIVSYRTADGTAGTPDDYGFVEGSIVFAPGETRHEIAVPLLDDDIIESEETFDFELFDPSGASIADGTGEGSIIDDDADVSVSIADATVGEGDNGSTSAVFVVALSRPASEDISIIWSTESITASDPADYVGGEGEALIVAGATTSELVISVTGDLTNEDDETFSVGIWTEDAVVADLQAIGSIVDDDPVPTVTIGDITMTEGTGGTTTASFTISLSNPTQSPVSVHFQTSPGSAKSPGDFEATSGTLTIAPDGLSGTVTVLVAADGTAERSEYFTVSISNAVGATIGASTGRCTILNDD